MNVLPNLLVEMHTHQSSLLVFTENLELACAALAENLFRLEARSEELLLTWFGFDVGTTRLRADCTVRWNSRVLSLIVVIRRLF